MSATNLISKFWKWRESEPHVVLGRMAGTLPRRERLTNGQQNHHVHIVGASGYGKTVLISHLLRQRVQQCGGLLFIDLKADIETIQSFRRAVVEAGREQDLQMFSLTDLEGSAKYNLLSHGTATQLRDRIMLSLNWSEEFYKNQAASFLLKALIGLCWLRDNRGLPMHLGTVLNAVSDPAFLQGLFPQLPVQEARIQEIFREAILFAKVADNWASLQGLRSQLESLVLSDFGSLISSEEAGIDLFSAAHEGKIVFVFLDTRRCGETAKAVGRFILQDLKAASARIDAEIPKADRRPMTVIVDEFADLAQEDFIAFLDRARSSKISIVVAHQEICDLQRISPEFAGRLMGNTSTLYAFLQKRPESAEMIAAMAGTQPVTEETEQVEQRLFLSWPTGVRSRKTVEGFVIHPNVIKSLPVGRCVCVKKYPRAAAYLVNVDPEWRRHG